MADTLEERDRHIDDSHDKPPNRDGCAPRHVRRYRESQRGGPSNGVGDSLLVAVSARLRACLRPDDTVARLGGDEFAILMTDLRPGESGHVAERVIGALGASLNAGNHDLLIQASIGLTDNDAGVIFALRPVGCETV